MNSNPYEAGSAAIRDEEQPGLAKNLRYALACEQFIGSYYVVLIAMLFTGVNLSILDVLIVIASLCAVPIGWLGLALGGFEFGTERKGRLRSARVALVCGAGAVLPTWTLAEYVFKAFPH